MMVPGPRLAGWGGWGRGKKTVIARQGLRIVALPFSSISADHDEIIATSFAIHLKADFLCARMCVFKQLPFVVAFRRFFFFFFWNACTDGRDERGWKIVKGDLRRIFLSRIKQEWLETLFREIEIFFFFGTIERRSSFLLLFKLSLFFKLTIWL